MITSELFPEYPYDIGYEAAWYCQNVAADKSCAVKMDLATHDRAPGERQ